MLFRLRWLAAPLALVLAHCATVMTPPYPPPPPLRAETLPLPPVSERQLVWQPGHWEWTGVTYDWQEGRYVDLVGHSTTWQPGFWMLANGRWTWQPAHWL